MRKTKRKVERFIQEYGLLKPGARVVVGLSGGPDSVCLSLMLHMLDYEVVAAHCNFHLRGAESMRDERFAEELCRTHGLAYHKIDFDTEEYAREHGISIEMAARELRYDWFRRLQEETKADAIAVGHHEDDNIETLLINLTRGTGIKGLCGMQPRNGDVIRPLLCLTRQEIEDFLQTMGQPYMIDHTNGEDTYMRNKVRLNIIPLLEGMNQGAKKNLASTIENLNEVEKVYRQAMKVALDECCQRDQAGTLRISKEVLSRQPSPVSVLHETLSPKGFTKGQLKEILSALNECGKVFHANGCRLLIDRDFLILEAEDGGTIRTDTLPIRLHQELVPVEQWVINGDSRFAYLDADKLHGELTVRLPQQGDTFAPFGMHGKRKLLSDYLTDQKLNRFEKERQPLLMDGEEIVWVVGRRSSDLYRVDATTTRVLVLQVLN